MSWARMDGAAQHRVPQLQKRDIPRSPGVYALYRGGERLYVGKATSFAVACRWPARRQGRVDDELGAAQERLPAARDRSGGRRQGASLSHHDRRRSRRHSVALGLRVRLARVREPGRGART
jgi:hypothetical protein